MDLGEVKWVDACQQVVNDLTHPVHKIGFGLPLLFNSTFPSVRLLFAVMPDFKDP